MRAVLALVLGVVAVRNQVHPDERVEIEAGDRVTGKLGEIQLELVVDGIQPAPVDAIGQDLVVTGVHELAAVPIVNEDIVGLDAGGLELLDHLQDDLERRMRVGLAVGHNLDADDVARLEEVLPAFDGLGGAGELPDSAIHRGLDRGRVALAVDDHARVSHLDDAPGIEPRCAQLAGRQPRPALMSRLAGGLRLHGRGQPRQCRDQGNRRRRAQEGAAIKAATGISLLHECESF